MAKFSSKLEVQKPISDESMAIILWSLSFLINFTNGQLQPIRESLTLFGGKSLVGSLMTRTIYVSFFLQTIVSYLSSNFGGSMALQACLGVSILVSIVVYLVISTSSILEKSTFICAFYLWFTFYNMTAQSIFWALAGDLSKRSSVMGTFGKLASAGTLGYLGGSVLASYSFRTVGPENSILVLICSFIACWMLLLRLGSYDRGKLKSVMKDSEAQRQQSSYSLSDLLRSFKKEVIENIETLKGIFQIPILFNAFFYTILTATALGLTIIERTDSAKRSGITSKTFGSSLANNQAVQGLLQSFIQAYFAGSIIQSIGSPAALTISSLGRFILFSLLVIIQLRLVPDLSEWYFSVPTVAVSFVIVGDCVCRLVNLSIAKPLKEALWVDVPTGLKYRAKVIVDVFAHRIGTALAALLSDLPLTPGPLLSLLGLPYQPAAMEVSAAASILAPALDNHIVWGVVVSVMLLFTSFALGTNIDRPASLSSSSSKAKTE